MMSPKISMFSIVSSDLPASLAFYRRLGLEIPAEADNAPHVDVPLPGGLRLSFDPVETVRGMDPDWVAPTGGNRFAIAFEVESASAVDELYLELTKDGYRGHKEPWDAVWGQRYALVLDPDGNVIDLFAAL
jgi:catechol 2,3-dioxygenase-like lactoylglutathione lyase family enzyme